MSHAGSVPCGGGALGILERSAALAFMVANPSLRGEGGLESREETLILTQKHIFTFYSVAINPPPEPWHPRTGFSAFVLALSLMPPTVGEGLTARSCPWTGSS